jgi:hypothetical protein
VSFFFPLPQRLWAGVGTLLVLLLLVAGCSDDPILGPGDGEKEEGGSYSVIKRLAPADSSAAPVRNPERF